MAREREELRRQQEQLRYEQEKRNSLKRGREMDHGYAPVSFPFLFLLFNLLEHCIRIIQLLIGGWVESRTHKILIKW